jgi:hypothetical protein
MIGMCAQVQVGNKAALSDLENGFELALVAGDQPGLLITEVTPEHILMEDVAAGVITRVPTYLIKLVRTAAPTGLPNAA